MSMIVVTFDRLPARLLATYGNEWMETPAFDQLAARSLVFEQHFVEIPGPAGPSHPWWTGASEYFSSGTGDAIGQTGFSAVETLVQAGVDCHLITERASGLPLDLFSAWEHIEAGDGMDLDHSETPFARLVQRGLEIVAAWHDDSQNALPAQKLLWLHSRGVPSPWLPPRVFADLYLNELEADDEDEEDWHEHTGEPLPTQAAEDNGDPSEPGREFDSSGILDELATSPALVHSLLSDAVSSETPETDSADAPDELERMISCYIFAGYVSLLDHWLGRLVRGLDQVQADNPPNTATQPDSPGLMETYLIVTSAGGFPTMNRRAFSELSAETSDLCDELLQTPLLIHQIGNTDFGMRCRSLTGPQNLGPTLCELAGLPAPNSVPSLLGPPDTAGTVTRRELLHLSPSGSVALRTVDWLLVLPEASIVDCPSIEDNDELFDRASLFALPGDMWQTNNVASRRRDVVAQLALSLQATLQTAGRIGPQK
ncbi:MAG: hypothetical protein VB858_02180 [Planctomycetaceae bacterium]